MPAKLKLGSRRSLLAIAQSRIVARELESKNPGLSIDIIGIDTRGDQQLDVPLSKMEGKDFFVAELDKALLNGDADITVHSMKDLSLDRPAELASGANPPRENPRDVVLFAADVIERLKTGKQIRLGTSSPRRIENVPPFLSLALPQLGQSPRITAVEIRGNVHTRISRLKLPQDDPRKIDAVVLAFAGLIRLWQDQDGRAKLSGLLQNLRWMVLPLKECPAAPAQGALAIECRKSDTRTIALLQELHATDTALAVARERQLLKDWGGGCHQALGATAESHPEFGTLMFVRGRKPDGTLISSTHWDSDRNSTPEPCWDGTHWRKETFRARYFEDLPAPRWLERDDALFVAHSRALPASWRSHLSKSPQRVWTSGTHSWRRLAAQGIWVEGCAEELGFDAVRSTLEQPVLQLPGSKKWRVLTHNEGADSWGEQQVLATYTVQSSTELHTGHPAVIELRNAQAAFWTSGSQYELFRKWIPDDCVHASRYGKTYNYLREAMPDKTITAFPSAAEWRASANASN